MVTYIVKYLFIYFFCIFICTKSLSIFKISLIENLIISIVLSIGTYLLSIHVDGLSYTLPLLLLWITSSIHNSQPQVSFIAITISFTISFCIHSLSSLIVLSLAMPFFSGYENYSLLALTTGIIQSLLTIGIFSIKRLRNGIPFLTSATIINFATFFCAVFTCFLLYLSVDYKPFHLKKLTLFSCVIALAFLIYWWQAQITKSYRKSLMMRELESLRIENAKLLEDNERMARMTHRDNTLITTLKKSTVNYLRSDFTDSEEADRVRDKLIANIEKLAEGRAGIASDNGEKKTYAFDTHISLLDELLQHMEAEALERNIVFSVHVGTELETFIPQAISESDLVHTVDDLLKNAFKSTLTCERRVVQLQFYQFQKRLVIEVADTGIPFEVKSLVNMGIEKLTTYADGSGIGLVDIWSTKEKYGATYHLEEYAIPSSFSKKISLTFDKKNRYSIRTWRKDEILQMSKRADLQVYEHME